MQASECIIIPYDTHHNIFQMPFLIARQTELKYNSVPKMLQMKFNLWFKTTKSIFFVKIVDG